ncbi:MAG: hypothetical protein RMJ36_00420 [Candidatus Calescibacterium sp.]|nr:hypothetical protein [Candidatus Calescibacterium sp.]MDW8132109.1 hypothetical protein [Candidatus Calescibacterium sp.]
MSEMLPQILMNAIPAVIGSAQSAAQNLQQSHQQAVETYMQKKKEFQNLVMQDLQKKREAQKKMFEQLKQSNENKQEKQQSIGNAWAQALGMGIDWGQSE